MGKKNAIRVLSSVGRAWPAYGVTVKVGKSEHVNVPADVMAQLEGLQEAGLLTVEKLKIDVEDDEDADYSKEDLKRERRVVQRMAESLASDRRKLENDFTALAEEQSKLKAERDAFEKSKAQTPPAADPAASGQQAKTKS